MRRLLGKLIKTILLLLNAYFVMIGVLATVLFFSLIATFAHVSDFVSLPTKLDEGSRIAVGIELDGFINDDMRTWRFRPKDQTSIRELRELLDLSIEDARVETVLLEIGTVYGDFTAVSELRAIIAELVAHGKQVIAYLQDGDNTGYFIASASEQIIMPPAASILITGPVFNLTYLGKMLKDFGVGIDVLRTGNHKNVFEFLQENRPSDDTVQMYAEVESSLREQMVNAIAAGRQRPPAQVEQWLRRSLYTPQAALDAGIIDSINHKADLWSEWTESGVAVNLLDARDYMRISKTSLRKPALGIGYVEASGQIMMRGNAWQDIIPASIAQELKWMRENDDIAAVVMRIDSGGGSALASELIWQHVKHLSAAKPVVVTMGEYAASGGYYIAVGANYLMAEAGTLTGSIGVASLSIDLAEFSDKYGVSFHTITQTERENMFNIGRALSHSDRKFLQASLQDTYELFVQRVYEQRDLPMTKVREFADGRVFTGEQAYALGLVDAVGGITEAFSKASALAGFAEDSPYKVYRYPRRYSLWACLKETLDVRDCLSLLERSRSISDRLLALAQDRVVAVWLGALVPLAF
ncbi:MAG: signal peptide peptidase SppA [Pseudomonadota bacterium]|nr:signal peptide peptidase SppA [Pseudomonadota bacterium]